MVVAQAQAGLLRHAGRASAEQAGLRVLRAIAWLSVALVVALSVPRLGAIACHGGTSSSCGWCATRQLLSATDVSHALQVVATRTSGVLIRELV